MRLKFDDNDSIECWYIVGTLVYLTSNDLSRHRILLRHLWKTVRNIGTWERDAFIGEFSFSNLLPSRRGGVSWSSALTYLGIKVIDVTLQELHIWTIDDSYSFHRNRVRLTEYKFKENSWSPRMSFCRHEIALPWYALLSILIGCKVVVRLFHTLSLHIDSRCGVQVLIPY